jgi:hypothetical protein
LDVHRGGFGQQRQFRVGLNRVRLLGFGLIRLGLVGLLRVGIVRILGRDMRGGLECDSGLHGWHDRQSGQHELSGELVDSG